MPRCLNAQHGALSLQVSRAQTTPLKVLKICAYFDQSRFCMWRKIMGDLDQTSSPEILEHFGPFTLGGGVPFLSLLNTYIWFILSQENNTQNPNSWSCIKWFYWFLMKHCEKIWSSCVGIRYINIYFTCNFKDVLSIDWI